MGKFFATEQIELGIESSNLTIPDHQQLLLPVLWALVHYDDINCQEIDKETVTQTTLVLQSETVKTRHFIDKKHEE